MGLKSGEQRTVLQENIEQLLHYLPIIIASLLGLFFIIKSSSNNKVNNSGGIISGKIDQSTTINMNEKIASDTNLKKNFRFVMPVGLIITSLLIYCNTGPQLSFTVSIILAVLFMITGTLQFNKIPSHLKNVPEVWLPFTGVLVVTALILHYFYILDGKWAVRYSTFEMFSGIKYFLTHPRDIALKWIPFIQESFIVILGNSLIFSAMVLFLIYYMNLSATALAFKNPNSVRYRILRYYTFKFSPNSPLHALLLIVVGSFFSSGYLFTTIDANVYGLFSFLHSH